MTEISDEVVAAAKRADRDGYHAIPIEQRPMSWTRVPDDQVRRLIAGAVAAERERIAELESLIAALREEQEEYYGRNRELLARIEEQS